MEPDLTIELINATVQIEQPLPDGRRTVGTGFLVEAPTPDDRPAELRQVGTVTIAFSSEWNGVFSCAMGDVKWSSAIRRMEF